MLCYPSLDVCVWEHVGSFGNTTSAHQTPLKECTREEQRVVIRFLDSEGWKLADIQCRLKNQYGDTCMWYVNGTGRLKVCVKSGGLQAAPVGLTLQMGMTLRLKWNEWYRKNQWITIDEVTGELKINHNSAHHIVNEVLQYRKLFAR